MYYELHLERQKVEMIKEALEWYAKDEVNWIAREALKKLGEME